jgi:serpin B
VLTRRQTVQTLGGLGVAVPLLAACGDSSSTRSGAGADPRLISADVSRSDGNPSAVAGVVRSMDELTADLWRRVGGVTGNLALSPYSIAVALAMTVNGAAGRTAEQMLGVLHVGSLATYNAGMAALTQELAGLAGTVEVAGKPQQIALSAANQLFGDRSMTWRRAFLTVLAKEYGAGVVEVDFRRDPEAARTVVNDWTAEHTRHRIPQLLPGGVVDETTRLVLVNALYFKAPWKVAFERSATAEATFHRADGSTVRVPMMKNGAEGPAVFLAGRQFSGARLPYGGDTLAMTVALPTDREDAAVAALLGHGGLDMPGEAAVALTMPRWSFRVPTDLRGALEALGMTDAFDGSAADFSPMTADERLDIQFVRHQAFVAVDEDGTEAAAATAVGMADSAVMRSHELVLDRPFLFVIHDTVHGTPLFVGRVADPASRS